MLGGGALAGGGPREGVQGGGGEDELVRQRRVSAGNAQAASMTKTESEGGTHAFKVRYAFLFVVLLGCGSWEGTGATDGSGGRKREEGLGHRSLASEPFEQEPP